jgi:hypothetical protein
MTDLADKMKHWPILAAHRMTEIEAVLLSFEERLAALEPPVEAVPPEEEPNPLDGERSDS